MLTGLKITNIYVSLMSVTIINRYYYASINSLINKTHQRL